MTQRFHRPHLWLLAALCSSFALPSCGGSSSPAENPSATPAPAPEAKPESAKAPATEAPIATEQPTEPADAPAASSPEAPAEKAEDPDNRQRQVFYRNTPQGMAVSVEGVEIRATAEPIKLKNGGFGILLKMEAESKDGAMHTLLSPKDGPLAVGGTITRKKGEPVQITSERKGEDDQFIAPDSPIKWEYSWPPADGPFAWFGDKIELQVGLWGLGNAGERRRPVRKLFMVEMTATQHGKPVIIPPKI